MVYDSICVDSIDDSILVVILVVLVNDSSG